MSSSEWTFEWITSWDEIWASAFQEQWKAWLADSPTAHVFFEPALVRAWHDTYRPLRKLEPRFAVARHGGDGLVFLPLVCDRGGWKDAWQRALLPVGHCEFDYHDPIAVGRADEALWSSYWPALEREIVRRWLGHMDMVLLGRFRKTTSLGEFGYDDVDQVPYVDVTGCNSIVEFLAGGDHKKLRQDVGRKLRKLDEHGTPELRMYRDGEAGKLKQILSRFAEEHHRRWPSASTPYSFYSLLADHCDLGNTLVFSELVSGGEPLSWKVCFRYGKLFFMYVQAMCKEHEDYYPGIIHSYMCIDWAIKAGCHTVFLGRGNENWKSAWADGTIPLMGKELHSGSAVSALKRTWQGRIRPVVVAAKRYLSGLPGKIA